jgi:hypothetical protein
MNSDWILALIVFNRQQFLPPAHYPIGLGEKAVSSQIHPIAAVVDGLGNPTDLCIAIEDDGLNVGPAQQFESGR